MAVIYEFESDVNAVFKLLTNAKYLDRRNIAIGDFASESTIEKKAKKTIVSIDRIRANAAPRFIAKILPDEQILHTLEEWYSDGEDGWLADQQTRFEGPPVAGHAQIELYPTEKGCCYHAQYSATVNIPLISTRVKKYVIKLLEEKCKADLEYLSEHLSL